MEEKTVAAELPKNVDNGQTGEGAADLSKNAEATRTEEGARGDSRAVIPGAKSGGAPAGSGARRGEGDPSASRLSAASLRMTERGEASAASRSGSVGGEGSPAAFADGSPRAEEPYGARGDGLSAAVTFAARSARLADEAEALYAEWTSSAEGLKRDYPAFDLAAAAREPAFGRLLRAGVDLRSAYEATHMPLVREAIRASAAAEAEARALDGVRLRGLRPDENGARPGGAVITGGMAGLSREQRARIAEKAMRGLL